jgi:oligopeptide transport system permease protein
MTFFIFRRILWGIPVLLTVATLTFGLLHVVPGGPFDTEKNLPAEIKANVEAKYHLDRPVWDQYVLYLSGLLRGDLGPSFKYTGRTVGDVISDSLPVSVQLGLLSLGLSLVFGIGAGIAAAVRPRGWTDRLSMLVATAGISVPSFVIGALLIMVFAFDWKLLPPALWEGWRNLVLPSVTLALLPAAYVARLTRSSLLEVIGRDYIRTGRAKGLGEGTILFKHALVNALSPVISFVGPLTAALVTGSFVVEYMYSIPGMGRFFITAVTNRDYPLIMGVTLVYAVLIVLANIAVDLVLAWTDPRIRLEGR